MSAASPPVSTVLLKRILVNADRQYLHFGIFWIVRISAVDYRGVLQHPLPLNTVPG